MTQSIPWQNINTTSILLVLFTSFTMMNNIIGKTSKINIFTANHTDINIPIPVSISNICPATTVDLSTAISTSNMPIDNVLEWHFVEAPVDRTTFLEDVKSVLGGIYYCVLYDTLNACYSNSNQVKMTIDSCNPPLSISNICPATTVNLTTAISASNLPANAILEWHTVATPVDHTSLIGDATSVLEGTYYGVFYDTANGCYSHSTAVNVTQIGCCTPKVWTNRFLSCRVRVSN